MRMPTKILVSLSVAVFLVAGCLAIGVGPVRAEANSPPCVPGADQVAIYEHPYHSGICIVRGVGSYDWTSLSPLMNDSASSIRVGANARAILFREPGFGGVRESFTADDPDFLDNPWIGNDTLSSLRVQSLARRPWRPCTRRRLAPPGSRARRAPTR